MEFQTVATLHKELKSQDEATLMQVSLDCGKIRFGCVTFTGKTTQSETKVKEQDDWNYLDFYDTSDLNTVKDVMAFLEPHLQKHGDHAVLSSGRLIKTIRKNICSFEKIPQVCFHQTSMNPCLNFVKEFEVAYSTVLKDDQQLMLTWLRKKIPQDFEPIYLIDTVYHFGSSKLIHDLGSELFKKIFVQDPISTNIYVSKLSLKQVKLISGTLTLEEKLKEVETWIVQ